jgi:DNA repair exonuclease SbcCD ATPase subunit
MNKRLLFAALACSFIHANMPIDDALKNFSASLSTLTNELVASTILAKANQKIRKLVSDEKLLAAIKRLLQQGNDAPQIIAKIDKLVQAVTEEVKEYTAILEKIAKKLQELREGQEEKGLNRDMEEMKKKKKELDARVKALLV